MGCIYCAECTINGKRYVGQTVKGLRVRRREHERSAAIGSALLFHRALRKHGTHAFRWFVVFDDATDDEIDVLEQDTIKAFRSTRPGGYNLQEGGNGGRPVEDVKVRTSATVRTQWQDKQHRRKKLVGLNKPEAIKRMSEASAASWTVERHQRAAMSYEERYGPERAAEIRRKQSAKMQGVPKSARAKANMRRAAAAKTPEHRHNSGSGLRAYNAHRAEYGISDEMRQKMSDSHRGRKLPAPQREKMRISQQARRARERASVPA